ncbi:alpha/beta fold hydrolase [Saccharopolyspora mangrovi]|uniref:Alpha/beta fold hydrolase n=1 Tax=Saccharopolyspora mangrovi TaxID=3082379 RepID=A0ABU6AER2_9PSEU|nr:alpha/beta fold hydrolase [Saccharopolyspora sp. S2-29]MEB3370030.1 alpha/beta fold hydrolase [Saccharopolyspora sp. S2-29]
MVLVHGYPDTSAVWRPVAERLADRFHVAAFDVRGAGASDRPRGLRAYRMSRLGADLEAVLDIVSPDRPVHLVGHDWGSIHSWESVTSTRLAGRIASFTSISGPCLDHVGHLIRARVRPTHPDLPKMLWQAARSWYIAYFHLPFLPALTWRALGHRWRAFLTGSQGVPGHTPYPAPTLVRDAVLGTALYRANMLPRLLRPRNRPTSVPIQLVIPTRDFCVTPVLSNGIERWARQVQRHPIDAGHWVQLSHPEEIASRIAEFAAGIEDGSHPTPDHTTPHPTDEQHRPTP